MKKDAKINNPSPNAGPALSASQLAAVMMDSRDICVSAAAGSGKTRVLVERFARAVLERGIVPDRIIAITYTQKAADELRDRIQRRLALAGRSLNEGREPAIGTIHGFCLRLLQENAIDSGLDPAFTVLQGDLYEGVLEESIEEVLDEAMRGEPERFGPILEYAQPTQLKTALIKGYERSRTLGCKPVPCPTIPPADLRERIKGWIADVGKWRGGLPEKQSSKILSLPDPSADLEVLLEELPELLSPLKSIRLTALFKADAGAFVEELEGLIALTADAVAAPYNALFVELMSRFCVTVEMRKRIGSWVDLHDLMDRVIELLERPAFRARIKTDYAALLIDEYQDVNALQAKLLDRLGSDLEVFVVGDARQSIYGFRHAESEFFIRRLERARANGSAVEIPENYRSHSGVISWINRVFEAQEHAGIPFGKLEARRVPAAVPPATAGLPAVEVLWSFAIEGQKPKAEEFRRCDAAAAAGAILKMTRQGAARFGEITVLLRGMTALAAYEDAFRRQNIPYHVIRGRGFYEKNEIVDLVNLFRAVKDPNEPIYAAALLRSPFAGLEDEDIRHIFYGHGKDGLNFGARIARALSDERLARSRSAIGAFWKWFEPLTALRQELTLGQILEKALAASAFETITLAQMDGLRRFANIRKFKDALKEFESLYGANLEAFVSRLEDRMDGDTAEEETEAAVASEKGNAVRIMTVHASKGLEFEVVVAADLSNTAPKSRGGTVFTVDEQARVVSNPPQGEDEREKSASFMAYQERALEKETEESVRLFYVAATRAREKLVLCGSLPIAAKKAGSAKSWTDRVVEAFPEAAEQAGLITSGGTDFRVERNAATVGSETGGSADAGVFGAERAAAAEDGLRVAQTGEGLEAAVGELLENIKDRSRPYRQSTDLSVSDLAEYGSGSQEPQERPSEDRLIYLAADREGEETLLGASDVGHVFHEMLQHTEHSRDPREEAVRLLQDFAHRMDAAARPEFEKGLALFMASRLAEDLRASQAASRPIYRELPFIYRMRGEGRELGSIKGQVDLLYEAPDGKWTLIDYKTTVSEKKEHHDQLRLYAFCLKKLLAGRPHRAALYYSREGLLVPVDLSGVDGAEFESKLIKRYQAVSEELLVE